MKKILLSLVLVLLVFGCKSSPKNADSTEKAGADATAIFMRGNDFYHGHAFDLAINEFTEVLKKDPGMADAYISRGNAYSCKLDFENALNDYLTGAQKNAFYRHYAQGYARYLDGDYQTAINEFTEAISLKSNLFAAYNDRGLAYANSGNQDLAIADFSEAININPNFALAYNNRGNAYLKKGNYDKAIQDYTKAIELYPGMVFSYSGRGLANYWTKNYDKAIEDYNKALAITPNDHSLYTLRGDAYSARGQRNLADADYAMADALRRG
ncbi:MAG: tetratricopeptide repeat protein [Treponema sp.]|jgi:tetratricopeptide (TPR) repeat protein|nr:tetratricopeptide repeat protein [Treponema sp.]